MNRLRLIQVPLLIWTVVCGFVPAHAGLLTIGSDGDDITVEANEVAPDDILARLALDYRFAVERIGAPVTVADVWGQFRGPLEDVIANTLRNQSYSIVYSASASHGIERVVVYGVNVVPPPAAAPAAAQPAVQPVIRAQTRSAPGRPLASLSPKPLPKEVIPPPATAQR